MCNSPLPPVSRSLSEQGDWLSERPEPSFHLGIIRRDGDLPGSPAALECSERFLLPFTDSLFQLQSLPCRGAVEETHSHGCTMSMYLTADATEET